MRNGFFEIFAESKFLSLFVGLVGLLATWQTLSDHAPPLPDFANLISEASLSFSMPDGFEETAVIHNPDVIYHYAIRAKEAKIEVRYSIEAFGNDDQRNKPVRWMSMTMATAFNISAGADKGVVDRIKQMPDSEISKLNAELGAVVMSNPSESSFGGEYKQCMFFSIFKSGKGLAAIYLLYDDTESLQKVDNSVLYSLRFKED